MSAQELMLDIKSSGRLITTADIEQLEARLKELHSEIREIVNFIYEATRGREHTVIGNTRWAADSYRDFSGREGLAGQFFACSVSGELLSTFNVRKINGDEGTIYIGSCLPYLKTYKLKD